MSVSPYVMPGIIPVDLSPDAILGIVAGEFGLTLHQVLQPGKKRNYSMARHTAMYFIKKRHPKINYADISLLVGRKDHTTCMHAIHTVQNMIDTKYPDFYPTYLKIKSKISIK